MNEIKFKIIMQDSADPYDTFIIKYNSDDTVKSIIDKLSAQIFMILFGLQTLPVWINKELFKETTLKTIRDSLTEKYNSGEDIVTFDHELLPFYSGLLCTYLLDGFLNNGNSIKIDISQLKIL